LKSCSLFYFKIADFTKVLELDANNANAYFNRGSTHDSIGQFDLAIADYTRALDLDRQLGGANGGGGLAQREAY
jgi:tetratricopeptide (TPR) repeat protein